MGVSDLAANPAAEVMGSLRPTMATQDLAFEVCSSSPWSETDYHAELFDLGDDAHQCVSFAPTWVANPSISEARTHELEPDERVWAREYAAIPGGTVSAALDPADITAAFHNKFVATGPGFIATDASSLRKDGFAWIAGRSNLRGLSIGEVVELGPAELKGKTFEDVVASVSGRAQAWGTRTIFGDQRERAGLEALFSQKYLTFMSYAWSEASKEAAFSLLRQLLRDRKLAICPNPGLYKEMTGCQMHLMPSGRVKYVTNGLDRLSALVTLCHAINDHKISVSSVGTDHLNACLNATAGIGNATRANGDSYRAYGGGSTSGYTDRADDAYEALEREEQGIGSYRAYGGSTRGRRW